MKEFKKENKSIKILNNKTFTHKFLRPVFIFLVFNSILISGCSNLKRKEDINICSTTTLPCQNSNHYVLLITNRGKIKIKVYGQSAPITVGNFIDLVEKGAYNKTIFNRVIKKPYPFIIRGGEKNLKENKNKSIDFKTEKKRYIPLEIKLRTRTLPIYGKEIVEPMQIDNIELKHKRSYLSMARSKNLNSASLQFNILLKSLPELDGRYAVFGKVINGMKIVDLIEEEDFIIEARRVES